jgi:vesicle-fusing ATPase
VGRLDDAAANDDGACGVLVAYHPPPPTPPSPLPARSPGRLEVHVEIGLPDEEGRVQILNIHTAEMRKNGLLAPDVSVTELAARTKNYTGAELEGLVKAAASYVFQRQVDPNDLSKVNTTMAAVTVTREDFERALTDLQPQFGVREDELARAFEGGIVNTGSDFERVKVTLERLVEQLKSSERSSLMSVLLTGPSGSGKTALAAKVALASGFPFVKRISGETLLNHHEGGKADAVARVFNDAYKSPLSLIILDDIERLIEYVAVGPRFSNVVLQTLLVLTKALPPKGRKLMIIGTTGIPELLDQMELASGFQLSLGMPLVTEEAAYAEVLSTVGRMPSGEAASVARFMAGKALGIKKLLAIIDMARDPAGTDPNAPVSEEAFMEALTEWGV